MPIENNQVTINQKINSKFKKTSNLLKEKFFTKKVIKSNIFKVLKSHYFWVFIFGLVLNAFIFRAGLLAYPDIIKGDSLLGPEELVPISDFKTQFIDQQTQPYSLLTSNFEFRIRYSWLTTWVRFYLTLPLALVVLNAVTLLLIYSAVFRILKNVFQNEDYEHFSRNAIIIGALGASLVSYFILIYNKITHFYTLIFGFGLFSIVVSLLFSIYLNYSKTTRKQKLVQIITITLLIVINPATHYIVLSLFIVGMILTLSIIVEFTNLITKKNKPEWGKIVYFLGTIITSAVGYLVYYFTFITNFNSFSVSDYVYLTRTLVTTASSNYLQIFSLQTGSILDFYQFTSYQIKPQIDRQLNIVYSFCIILLIVLAFLPKRFTFKHKINLRLAGLILFITAISVFFASGYSSWFSAHNFASYILSILNTRTDALSQLLTKAITTFFLILRFPHRFLFIFQLMTSFAVGIVITYLVIFLENRVKVSKTILRDTVLVLVLVASVIPYLAGDKISRTLFSGNYDYFLEPYKIPSELKEMKSYLANNSGGRLLVLPSSEVPYRVSQDKQGVEFKLIDKFFIYYLDYPSYYYGLSSDKEYKNAMMLVYLNVSNQNNWFNLVRNKDIEYILVNKTQTQINNYSYRNGLEGQFYSSIELLKTNGLVKKVSDGNNFSLYQINKEYVGKKTNLYLNNDWQSSQDLLFKKDVSLQDYTINDSSKEICKEKNFITFGQVDKQIIDINVLCNKRSLEFNNQLVPFIKSVESTDDYISSAFSLLTTSDSPKFNKYNKLNSINPGTYNSLTKTSAFLVDSNASAIFSLDISEEQKYNLAIRAKSVENKIQTVIKDSSGQKIYDSIQNLADTKNYKNPDGDAVLNNFDYYTLAKQLNLKKGKYTVTITKIDDNPIGIDTLTFYTDQQLSDIKNSYQITKKDTDLYEFIKK